MSDPQDLLYTNNFISSTVLSNKQLNENAGYYDRFIDYEDNIRKDDYDQYINNDSYESSDVNKNNTLNNKWPVGKNKNHYPLFDKFMGDISEGKYKKEIITKVNVDSNNRDLSIYKNSNKFTIPLNQVYNNITKVILSDIIFPNLNTSVTNYNNNIAWQYASKNYLVVNDIDTNIIPVPESSTLPSIAYSSLPFSVFDYTTIIPNTYASNVDNYLVYQCEIEPGYYTVSTMASNLIQRMSNIVHGNNAIVDKNNIVEQPYSSFPKKIGTPQLFDISVNDITSIVKFVNRIEEEKISAIQCFSPYETDFANKDPFYYYSSQYPINNNYTLNTNYIYVIVPAKFESTYQYFYNINCLNNCNAFPLVMTELVDDIGGIAADILNYTTFFDLSIYTIHGYTESELGVISYYKYIDTLTFTTNTTINGNNVTLTSNYLRFGLRVSTGLINGLRDKVNGIPLYPAMTQNFIYSSALNSVISNLNYTDYVYNSNDISKIGRALLFRWIYDKNPAGEYITYEIETINEKKRSCLHLLGWPIANETYNIYVAQINKGFAFVQTNVAPRLIYNSDLTTFVPNLYKLNLYPNIFMNLQNDNGKSYFYTSSYFYIKISFNTSSETTSNNLYNSAYCNSILQYNQFYVDPDMFLVGIGEDYTNIKNCAGLTVYKKSFNGFFAKIMLSEIPGNFSINNTNINSNNSYVINYDNVQDNVDNVTIEIYDYNFRLLNRTNDFSFTMEIHETRNVLKETLINTKTNSVSSTGYN